MVNHMTTSEFSLELFRRRPTHHPANTAPRGLDFHMTLFSHIWIEEENPVMERFPSESDQSHTEPSRSGPGLHRQETGADKDARSDHRRDMIQQQEVVLL